MYLIWFYLNLIILSEYLLSFLSLALNIYKYCIFITKFCRITVILLANINHNIGIGMQLCCRYNRCKVSHIILSFYVEANYLYTQSTLWLLFTIIFHHVCVVYYLNIYREIIQIYQFNECSLSYKNITLLLYSNWYKIYDCNTLLIS